MPHGAVPGLALHPSPSQKGHGKWVLRFVSPVTKKRRNAGLGAYPDVGIAQAARLARTMREQIAQGEDPLVLREEAARAPRVPTLREASALVHNELKPGWKNAKHAQQWINTLTEYVFPEIGNLPLDTIHPRNVADALRPIWLEKPETAFRVKQRLHAVMAWGWAHGFIQANPVDVVTHLLPQQPSKAVRTQHQPAMPWKDIPAFVKGNLADAGEFDVSRRMLLFLILTACRSGEVRGMTWDEIDVESRVWTIPAERMKAKLPHRVPLSKEALHILEKQQGFHKTLVFPSILLRRGRQGKSDQGRLAERGVMSDMVLTALLRRLKAPSDALGRFATAHGFRSSFRDWCSENGYARDLAERSLAHTVPNKVEAAYHRTDLLEQRRPMLVAWAEFACSLHC